MSLPPIITDTNTLQVFCAEAASRPFIALDTEFMRERTYYAELCLIQIAAHGMEAIIDPLAPNIDLAPLYALLKNPNVLKVLHASRQDLEIFCHAMGGTVATPVFDTQIAAQVIGLGENISYDQFIRHLLGKGVDKASRFTDWGKRPLSPKQLTYAIGDATFLRDAYDKLSAQLQKLGRESWVREEMGALLSPALYISDPRESWRRIKAGQRSARMLAVLRELAAWREREAMRVNIPRGRMLKDEALVELAASQPRTVEDIAQIRGLERGMNDRQKQAVLACIEAALASASDTWPQPEERPKDSARIEGAVAMLQLLLKVCAEEHGVSPALITGRDELEALARSKTGLRIQHGWRYDVFGREAEKMLRGETSIRFDPARQKASIS